MGSHQELASAYRLLIADVYELAGASRSSSERIAKSCGQTTARWHALSVLSAAPMSVADAARRLGLTRQSVQRVVDALRTDGCIHAAANPRDARAQLMSLTDSGQAALRRLNHAGDVERRGMLAAASVTPVELRNAQDVVRRITQAITQ